MARNDNFYLERWLRYYGAAFGEENLYVYLDGLDQALPSYVGEAHIEKLPHRELSRSEGDKYRIGLLGDLAAKLFSQGYDMVVGTDADEFIIVDPDQSVSLSEYLYQYRHLSTISALGLDLGQHLSLEKELDPSRSLLDQRQFAVLSSRYTKASILTRPLRWGSGFHRVKGHNFHILPHLYLVHTGYCDWERVRLRSSDTARVDGGWEAHLKRRAKTIYHVSNKKAIPADKMLKRARWMQSLFRPIYALNKPMMPTRSVVVSLPKRFRSIFI